MIHQPRPSNRPRLQIAEQDCVAISQRSLAAAAGNVAKTALIYVNAEIVIAGDDILVSVFMTDALRRSRQQAEPGPFSNRKRDSTCTSRNAIERYPSQSALIQRLHSGTARLHKHRVVSNLGHVVSRGADRDMTSGSFRSRSHQKITLQPLRSPVQSKQESREV